MHVRGVTAWAVCAMSIVVLSSGCSRSVDKAEVAPAEDAESSVESFDWVDTPGKYRELRFGDRPVIRYMYESYDDSSPERRDWTYKPFHHVYSPDGQRLLTKGDPGGLYPHHRGLFYGFHKITYDGDKRCDVWHCLEGAHQSHEAFLEEEASPEVGRHRVAIDWHGREGEVFAHEERAISVHNRPGGMMIDFQSHLETADGVPIHLDGDPQHAGFHFRAAQEVADETLTETYYLRTDGKGKSQETRNWNHDDPNDPMNPECTDRPWNAMSIVVGGERYTVLYLDHPDNPKPARYSERDYGRFGSYFVTDVTADKPLDVRYRIWVQKGEMTVDQCEALHREFVEATGSQ